MKIQQKLNLVIITIILIIIIPFGVSIFSLFKINSYFNYEKDFNVLTSLFYKEYLSINSYSRILFMEDLGDSQKNKELSSAEKNFLKHYDETNSLIYSFKKNNKDKGLVTIYDKLEQNNLFFKKIFQDTKDSFVYNKTKNEKISLALDSIARKRNLIEDAIFLNEPKLSTTTDSFYYNALHKFDEIKKFESLLLETKDKNSLDTLLSSINSFELDIKSSKLFIKENNFLLLFKDYKNELDIFFSENYDDENIEDLTLDQNIVNLGNELDVFFNEENNKPLLVLEENNNKKIKDIFLIYGVANFFFILSLVLILLIIKKMFSKEIITPISKLTDFSKKITQGGNKQKINIKTSNNNLNELARVLSDMDKKLIDAKKELLAMINDLKVKDNIEAVVQTLADGVIMYDRDRKIVLKNSSVKKILNISNEKLSLKNLYGVFAQHNLEFHVSLSLKTNEVYVMDNVELLGIKYEITISRVTDHENNIIGGLMVFHKKEEVDNSEHQKNDKIGFGPVISPHFGTPLSYIKLFTEMLSSGEIGKLNQEQKTCISNIHQSAVNMKEIIDKLHDISVLDEDKLNIKAEDIEIAPYIKGLIKEYSKNNSISGVDFNFRELLPEDIKVRIDKKIFSKVFNDLLDNALVYKNDSNPIVDVELKELGFNYLLSVKDNGIGIPEEEQDFIFDKFFRTKNAVIKNTKGSGISLYIAKRLLNKLGVELFFESKDGEGTTFFIEIPKGGMRV